MKLPTIRRPGLGAALSSRMMRVKRSIPRDEFDVPRIVRGVRRGDRGWIYALGGVLLAVALAGWARRRQLL